jgi:hypothetical protein
MSMRISISCLRCGVWFDNLRDLVEHRARHDAYTGPGPAELPDRASAAASDQSTNDAVCWKEARS